MLELAEPARDLHRLVRAGLVESPRLARPGREPRERVVVRGLAVGVHPAPVRPRVKG